MSTETTTGLTTTDTGAETADPGTLVEAADNNQNTDQHTGENTDQSQDQSTGQDMDPGCSGGGCPETGQQPA